MPQKTMEPVALKNVKIQDHFWKNYIELVRTKVIPYQWEALNDRIQGAEPSYCIQNFRVAAGLQEGRFQGMVFQDSDLYKWLEAVAYVLSWHRDENLERLADETIALMGQAQQADGYLNTYYIINGLDKRFTNLMDHHELYCLGHMVEAAVAYYKATGKTALLDIAKKFVACADANLGREAGKKPGYPGHEVAEMALVALYEVTGDPAHLRLAQYFVDQRGQEPLYFEQERKENHNHWHWEDSYFQMQYYQAGKPVRQQEKAEGHAVRAVYLYAGMVDVASKTGDEELFAACQRLWDNIVNRQMYVTGAIGSAEYGEAFTFDYDLPNDTVYAETCASIGLIFFARRMLEITKDARYADVMERALYNGVISGMSLDGTSFFYVNPLEVVPELSLKDRGRRHVKVQRQKWFGCSCCPPNLARLISSIGGYAFTKDAEGVYINLFVGGEVDLECQGEQHRLKIQTGYPWQGDVHVSFETDAKAAYGCSLRLPGWCKSLRLTLNGGQIAYENRKGYAYVHRQWQKGDVLALEMDMPVEMIQANPKVREDVGRVAVMRGPVVYCLEEADNQDQLQQVCLSQAPGFVHQFEPELLGGVVTILAQGTRLADWQGDTLYRTYEESRCKAEELKFIPYYAWANRNAGEMLVWVRI